MKHVLIFTGLVAAILLMLPVSAQARYTDGMNLYEYARSRPTVLLDPVGLTVIIPTFDDGPISVKWRIPGNCPNTEEEMLRDLKKILKELQRRKIKAVFYVLFLECDPKCPGSPKGSMKGVRRVFATGVKAIHNAGHIVALHACDHDLYQDAFVDKKTIKADVQKLMKELDDTGVPYSKTWRPPYGGWRTFANESDIASDLGLTRTGWSIDSEDWTYHHDAPAIDRWLYGEEEAWLKNVKNTLEWDIFWAGGRGEAWADILFHVNSRTASNLGGILDHVEASYKDVYGKKNWGPGKEFYWLNSQNINGREFKSYLGGN